MSAQTESLVKQMSLEEKAGQMIYAGVLEDDTHWPNEETMRIIQQGLVGAARIYGTRKDPYFCTAFMNQLQRWASGTKHQVPLLLGADLEVGASAICAQDTTTFAHQMAIGDTQSVDLADQISRAIARESLAIGLHMNHRPVADVNTNPRSPAVGIRSYSSDTERVCELVAAAVRSATSEGLLAIPKHFPGHGETDQDSHLALPTISCDQQTFRKLHLKPFQHALQAGAAGVMTAHLIVTAFDKELPATLSPRIMDGLLRSEMGFDGLIITDSMNMRGITSSFSTGDATLKAVVAGVDLVLSIGTLEAHLERREALVRAVRDKVLAEARIDKSVRRILSAKERVGLFQNTRPDPLRSIRVCGCTAHRKLARQSYLTAIKVREDHDRVLPLKKTSTVLVTGTAGVDNLGRALSRVHPRMITYALPSSPATGWRNTAWEDVDAPMRNLARLKETAKQWQPTRDELAVLERLTHQCDIVVALISGSGNAVSAGQAHLLESLARQGRTPIVITLGMPSAANLPACAAYLAMHVRQLLPEIAEALAEVLVGAQ